MGPDSSSAFIRVKKLLIRVPRLMILCLHGGNDNYQWWVPRDSPNPEGIPLSIGKKVVLKDIDITSLALAQRPSGEQVQRVHLTDLLIGWPEPMSCEWVRSALCSQSVLPSWLLPPRWTLGMCLEGFPKCPWYFWHRGLWQTPTINSSNICMHGAR